MSQEIERQCAAFAEHLRSTQAELVQLLTVYQSYTTTIDEIERSIDCLTSTNEISQFLGRRTHQVCTFFPLNLPIYSLLTKFFPNIETRQDSREDFVRNFVADADVTIFTGKESNARHVLQKTKKDSLFLFNGWGSNPIIVAPDADIDLAIQKTIQVKTFNSGQDCAGPDNILVHKTVAEEFINRLEPAIKQLVVGLYSEPDVRVGKIAEEAGLIHAGGIMQSYRDDIIVGGNLDFTKSIVWPTLIVSPLSKRTNYQELFSPIFFVSIYDVENELCTYFKDPRYTANEMYVSLFGNSEYVNSLRNSIVHRGNTILDVEKGNRPYGGFSHGASFVATNGNIEARPVLIPREFSSYLESLYGCDANKLSTDVFGNNLVFGFVLGGVAKYRASEMGDIDTMVVVRDFDNTQTGNYNKQIRCLAANMRMRYDEQYPSEIITQSQLEETLSKASQTVFGISGSYFNQQAYDIEVWTNAIGGIKKGMVGDMDKLLRFEVKAGKIAKEWKTHLIQELETIIQENTITEDAKNLDLKPLRKMSLRVRVRSSY
ncbi:Aldehyde/histidinol dehydrogenase [Halenospora varia]|nr:Aldehyde/histidinol dehydrogenase [Halenospora varia]